MNKKDDALRIAAKFLIAGYYGRPFTRQDMKTIADLCWVCIPMKYRMTAPELASLRESDYSIESCRRETNHAEVKGTGFCRCTHAMYS